VCTTAAAAAVVVVVISVPRPQTFLSDACWGLIIVCSKIRDRVHIPSTSSRFITLLMCVYLYCLALPCRDLFFCFPTDWIRISSRRIKTKKKKKKKRRKKEKRKINVFGHTIRTGIDDTHNKPRCERCADRAIAAIQYVVCVTHSMPIAAYSLCWLLGSPACVTHSCGPFPSAHPYFFLFPFPLVISFQIAIHPSIYSLSLFHNKVMRLNARSIAQQGQCTLQYTL